MIYVIYKYKVKKFHEEQMPKKIEDIHREVQEIKSLLENNTRTNNY